jgi:hypothetical protein
MRLHNCNGSAVPIRSVAVVLLLIIGVLISSAEIADADVYISGNFYYASGLVAIGGITLYFIVSSGTRGYHFKKVKPNGTNMVDSMNESDIELHNDHSYFDDLFHDGLLKIYKW